MITVYRLTGINIFGIHRITQTLFAYYIIFLILLLVISLYDYYTMTIPNIFILFGFLLGLCFNLDLGIKSVILVILETIIVVGAMYFVVKVVKIVIGEECIGCGDIKLYGIITLFLRIENTLMVLVLSIFFASMFVIFYLFLSFFRKKVYSKSIPFAPFISSSVFLLIYFQGWCET